VRVLVVTTSYPSREGDPAGHFVATEVAALGRAGHAVEVIAPGPSRVHAGVTVVGLGAADAFGWPGALARFRERPIRAVAAAGFIARAQRAVASRPHDRIVAHWLLPAAWPIARASSAPLEVVAHGSDVRLLARVPRPLARGLLAALLSRGASLRCVSRELADLLVAIDPRVAERLHVQAAAIDTSGVPDRVRARALLGVREAERLIVLAGRLVPGKRFDTALTAAELVPGARVVVLGDGPEAAALRERFPGARFLGLLPRARALAWIAAADLVLSTSRLEGAPTLVREARALGVPVVSARAGDLASWAELDPELWVVG